MPADGEGPDSARPSVVAAGTGWPEGVRAVMSTRHGGASQGAWAGFNLGLGVGDAPAAVVANRHHFEAVLGAPVAWLQQVHGTVVVLAEDVLAARASGTVVSADACVSRRPGCGAVVMVADCLPVLFARLDGQAVAAAHAGWRGLAAGVLQRTVEALGPGELMAWLGPCIGPAAFEVGDDVREAFGPAGERFFVPHRRSDGSDAWRCDLPALAADILRRTGVQRLEQAGACTVSQGSDFFSFRRDRVTGRMAAAIRRR
jgi:YfiH family protein